MCSLGVLSWTSYCPSRQTALVAAGLALAVALGGCTGDGRSPSSADSVATAPVAAYPPPRTPTPTAIPTSVVEADGYRALRKEVDSNIVTQAILQRLFEAGAKPRIEGLH